jgi:hypothetical protein
MGQTQGQAAKKAEFMEAAAKMYEELREWRANHLSARLDEIAEQVSVRRRILMGQLLSELAGAADEQVEAPVCERCGEVMTYKGTPERDVLLREGEMKLGRAYFHCERCESGIFPPGRTAGADQACLEFGDDPAGATTSRGDTVAAAGDDSLC